MAVRAVCLQGEVCCTSAAASPWVHTVDPASAFRDFQRLKLKYDKLLSNFACFGFNCKVRHYSQVDAVKRACFKTLPHTLCVHLKVGAGALQGALQALQLQHVCSFTALGPGRCKHCNSNTCAGSPRLRLAAPFRGLSGPFSV